MPLSQQTPASVDTILQRIDDFFMQKSPVHDTLRRLAQRLTEEQIPYAIIGGMALALQGFVRPTLDVDLLLTQAGLQHFHEKLIGLGYLPAFAGARKHFRDTETGVRIEIITAGEYPGDGKPKSIVFPDPQDVAVEKDGICVVSLEKLIELKLASSLSAAHRQLRDAADVQQLIEILNLPIDLAEKLDESVREEYKRLWHIAQKARDLEEAE